ncbi:hypothetical protein BGZ80_009449 [Entomortierella chlamydospora]|uniref:DUF202 domain-containing protein n=1 Tax=Entomortierella chlamydospora TaxID=101097 RepID=A0A9P6MXL4_9FUNG|nr:hypothetical protein BGZ79_004541 [Entomortierella chlamydospora]KAG0016072.1 hypothetical protein BGZ80_009449 [Entomortierella chlamydospora]
MNERKLHPFDVASTTSLPQTGTSIPPSSPGNNVNVTFLEATLRRASTLSQDNITLPAASQLRNRLDKPSAISDPNSSVEANTSCLSSEAGAGASGVLGGGANGSEPFRARRNTGPGGRFLDDVTNISPPSWKAKLFDYLQELYTKYSPSLTLENKGSIARDHLANERTFLAWLRSSLSLITVGVSITQLFRLQSSTGSTGELIKISELGRPLGGSFIILGIVFLWLGTSRYFHSQSVLSYGQFPASRGSVILATVSVMSVMLACFIIVILQGRTS